MNKNVREWMRVKECGRVGMNGKERNSEEEGGQKSSIGN